MRKWKRSGVLAGWLLTAVLGGEVVRAQVPTTSVQDVVTDASGVPAAGSIVISWGAFTTAAGVSVAAGSLSTTLGAGGALNVALQPNAGATPMGSYYTAVYHLSDGTTSREFWVVPVAVPGGGAAKLAGIRNQVLPTAMAMQTVSKQYVDTAVAKAIAGVAPGAPVPYVPTAGGAMSGPLALPADPALAMQAANKHYVDAAVAGVTAVGSASGDLGGAFPNPTVTAVHAIAGTVDGVPIGQTTPAAMTGTTGVFNGTFNGTALLRAGASAINNSGYSVMLVSQPLTLPGGGSHGYAESSALTGVAGSGGYSAFDCTITGTGTIDHMNCYQARQHALAGATVASFLRGYETDILVDAGASVAKIQHHYASDYSGSGTAGTQVGYFCGYFTKGSTNYCLYQDGPNPNELGGTLRVNARGGVAPALTVANGGQLILCDPSNNYCNQIYNGADAKLRVVGSNGGGVYFDTGSQFSFCNVGETTCAVTMTIAGAVTAVSFHEALTTPASSGGTCSAGDFTDDANFHYVCVAANTWKRTALSSF